MSGLLADVLSVVLGALLAGWDQSQSRQMAADAARAQGAAEGAAETSTIIAEVADARSALAPAADTPADLARRLRERADALAAGEPGGNVIPLRSGGA